MPSEESLQRIAVIAAETGDLGGLSPVDLEVLALGFEHNREIATDDHRVQNVAEANNMALEKCFWEWYPNQVEVEVEVLGLQEGMARFGIGRWRDLQRLRFEGSLSQVLTILRNATLSFRPYLGPSLFLRHLPSPP